MLPAGLCQEIEERIGRSRQKMREEGFTALLVYGNSKMSGSLRYVTGYFPDRGGWIATGPGRDDMYIFDGAVLVLPLEGEPVLAFETGQLLDREACTQRTTRSSLGTIGNQGPSPAGAIAGVLREARAAERVGIETWDRFPARLFLELKESLPNCEFRQSTILEEVSLVKSGWEIELFRKAGEIGDAAHQAFVDALRNGVGKSELDLIRVAEAVMRNGDPVYEECNTNSPSLICTGPVGRLYRLHVPLKDKLIRQGDVVHWDICMRYCGYPVDTSRTRVVGRPTDDQVRAYKAVLLMFEEVLKAARPGVRVQSLVRLADQVARNGGFELWDRFLGHGLGLDAHTRPDMGAEEMTLQENMVLAIEPRILLNDEYLFGNEDMVLITPSGAESLTKFPMTPLELD